ncbi:MAG: prepilin-type N-terminal cleavage/methylation domain-containing protein [Verrucomicrobiota bacterium]|jgi:prepilin-type N-terminal cleavage/methylation domain-containing protein
MEIYESKVEPSSLRFAAPRSRAVFAALRRARESSVEMSVANAARPRHPSPVTRHPSHSRAFTLIELLVVIAILGIMAGLAVPVLKNFAKSDATLGASRQLLDGAARARQLAISQRTTVYMVFVPTNFWVASGSFNTAWFGGLTLAQQTAATNLCDKQLTGYTFVSLRSVGDQPGQHTPHYLAPWQTLPDGTFIALAKFANSPALSYPINDPVSGAVLFNIFGFNVTNNFPFPTETATNSSVSLPWIAFNYLGQLTVDGQTVASQDEYIPIAKGSVLYARDPGTKAFQFNSPDVLENPPGNSTNSAYNVIHIDRLTGRAVLEYQKMQ